MTFRLWLRGALALALFAGAFAVPAAAQRGPKTMPLEDARIFMDIREGRQKFVKDTANAQVTQKNTEAIRKKAQVEFNRMLDAANTAAGSSDTKPISLVVRGLNEVIIDPANFSKDKLSEGQRDMIAIFGKEMADQIKSELGTKDKPSGSDMLVKVNAARMFSILGKSGYDGVARDAIEYLADPNQHDAVKMYVLEALQNVFAAPNPEKEGKSVIADPDLELKAIQALIDFIARKPKIEANAPQDEVDALRYVRRAAVRALGQVRLPIVRDRDGAIKCTPGIWLLRVANADRNLVPSPSLSERAEALAGFLFMQSDKEVNIDYAAYFVGTAIRDMTLEYTQRKALEKPKADDKEPPERTPEERDYQPWKLFANRVQIGLKVWKDNYEHPSYGLRPAEGKAIMAGLIDAVDKSILRPMAEGGRTDEISMQALENWGRDSKFGSATLFNEDKAALVQRPDAGK